MQKFEKSLGTKSGSNCPVNNAIQGLQGPCKGNPLRNCTDLAPGTAVAPHELNARVSAK